MSETMTKAISTEKNRFLRKKTKKQVFFWLMALPFLLEVAIFYVYVNISNIFLAFQEYTNVPGKGALSEFVWFKNFSYMLDTIFAPDNVGMIGVSFIMYGFILCIVTPIVIFFSFYIYKQFKCSGFFRVILFMPQIISHVVYVELYEFMLNNVYPELTGMPSLIANNGNSSEVLLCVMFFTLWVGFGSNILLMSGAMSGIDENIVEASHLDGCGLMREFVHITLPSIYPTISSFIILDMCAIFTNNMNLYTFFDQQSPIKSVGYYIHVNTIKSPGMWSTTTGKDSWLTYPQLSALGIMITVILLPTTLLVRRILEKVGPSED